MLQFPGLSVPAEVQFERFRLQDVLTPDLFQQRMQPHWDWIRQNTECSHQETSSAHVVAEHFALLRVIEQHPNAPTVQLYERAGLRNRDKATRIKTELLQQGMIQEGQGISGAKGGGRTKPLQLTDKGRKYLHAHQPD